MPTADGTTRLRAWIVTLLLGAVLAIAASLGVNHQYDTARERVAVCTAVRPSVDPCREAEPGRPGAVWAFGALAAVLVISAAGAGLRGVRERSVELVLRGVEPLAQ